MDYVQCILFCHHLATAPSKRGVSPISNPPLLQSLVLISCPHSPLQRVPLPFFFGCASIVILPTSARFHLLGRSVSEVSTRQRDVGQGLMIGLGSCVTRGFFLTLLRRGKDCDFDRGQLTRVNEYGPFPWEFQEIDRYFPRQKPRL